MSLVTEATDVPVDSTVPKTVPAIEMHSDITIDVARRRREGETHVLERIFLPKWKQGGVRAAFVTVGGDSPPQCPLGNDFPLESAIYLTQAMLQDIAESDGRVVVATKPGDLRDAAERGAFPLVLHVEGSRPFEFDSSSLRMWHLLGVRSVALTWNFRNAFADGASESRTNGGLTHKGVRFLGEIEELNLILDLAHLSEAGFWQVFEHYSKPIVVSHAACRAVRDHERNITDEQMREVARRNGVFGLAFYPSMVGEGPATMDIIMRHLVHAAEVVGTEHLAFGPDFIDYAPDLIVPRLKRSGYGYNVDFPPELGSITQLQNLVPHMKRFGFSDDDIERIMWGNIERIFDACA